MLVEIIGGVVEFPFDKLTDPNELRDRTIYVEYDDNSRLVRYTVKHHDVITGELVAPEGA